LEREKKDEHSIFAGVKGKKDAQKTDKKAMKRGQLPGGRGGKVSVTPAQVGKGRAEISGG